MSSQILGFDYIANGRDDLIKFSTPRTPNRNAVEPDGIRGTKEVSLPKAGFKYFPGSSWFEVKATYTKSITGSSFNNQVRGLFDALNIQGTASGVYAKGHRPTLTFVTTWDANLGKSIDKLEKQYKINVYQQYAFYYIENGQYYISFGMPGGRKNPFRLVGPAPKYQTFVKPKPVIRAKDKYND